MALHKTWWAFGLRHDCQKERKSDFIKEDKWSDWNKKRRGGLFMSSPSFASGLHLVGNVDVLGPNVVLPLSDTNYSWEDEPTVYSNSHVDRHVVLLPGNKKWWHQKNCLVCQKATLWCTYIWLLFYFSALFASGLIIVVSTNLTLCIRSIILRPIAIEFLAWSGSGVGAPATQ